MPNEVDSTIDREVSVNLNAETGYAMVIKPSGSVIVATGQLGESLLNQEDDDCCE